MIRDESVVITSPLCDPMPVVRVYPVFDLVARPPDAPQVGPAIDFQPLTNGVTSTVAPSTWDDAGGPGWAMYFANAGVLIISQTVEAHREVAAYLRALREVAATSR